MVRAHPTVPAKTIGSQDAQSVNTAGVDMPANGAQGHGAMHSLGPLSRLGKPIAQCRHSSDEHQSLPARAMA